MADDGWSVSGAGKKKAQAAKVAKRAREKSAYEKAPSPGRVAWFAEKDRAGKGGLNAEYHALENTAKSQAKTGKLHQALNNLDSAIGKREEAASYHGGGDAGHKKRIGMLRARRNSIARALE